LTQPNIPQEVDPSALLDAKLKSLSTLLGSLRDGMTRVELAEAVHELVSAVRDTGKKASLTLKLTVAPATNISNDHTLIVTDDIAVTYPKRDKSSTILFADEDNQLTRRDPRQPRLAFEQQNTRGVSPFPPVDPAAE
jgi:hypothetical protein